MAVVAERAFTSHSTLQKVEAGNVNVSIGIYAAVLQALGLLDGLGEIADIARDSVGQALASAELPKRPPLAHTGADRSWLLSKFIIDIKGRTRPVGPTRSKVRSSDAIVFEYAPAWIADPDRFAPLA